MRALSIPSLVIQACIVSVAIWPNPVGAEENFPATFQIEISQPEYSPRAGGTWVCSTEQLLRSECRQDVPLIIFGEPTLAQIQVRMRIERSRLVSPATEKRKAVEVYASLNHPGGGVYRADGGEAVHFNLLLNTDGSLAKEIQFRYWGKQINGATNPVARHSPPESHALKITPVAAR